MKVLRQIIEIDEEKCDGCGLCVPACEEGAIQIINGKAKVVSEKYCDGLGACLGHCPKGAIKIVEREAEEFDPEAVEEYLKTKEQASCKTCEQIESVEKSQLGHWPIQIKLIPYKAPYLKNSDLLILADCAAVAYPHLHRDFLKDKIVMMGCPKFDNKEEYVDKFVQIFKENPINSITIVMMEVPCCSGLKGIIEIAQKEAKVEIPTKIKIISIKGEIKL